MNVKISEELLAKYKTFLKQDWGSNRVGESIEELIEDQLRKNLVPAYDRDLLTGCKNRFYIRHDFENAVLKCKNADFHTTYICFDIEHFKNYLDYYGIAAGDQKLIDIASQIQNRYPQKNVYRYGGDEFVLELESEEFTPIYVPDVSLKYSVVEIVVKWSKYRKRNFEREIYYYLETGFFESTIEGTAISYVYLPQRAG